jgi:hypothetical protein
MNGGGLVRTCGDVTWSEAGVRRCSRLLELKGSYEEFSGRRL